MAETPGVLAGNLFKQVHTPDGLEIGHIRYQTIDVLNVSGGETKVVSATWPYPIGISSGALLKTVYTEGTIAGIESIDIDDSLYVWADIENPGIVTLENAQINDTTIKLSTTVINVIKLSQGDILSTNDDLNSGHHLHVVSIDRDTGIVTFETPLTAAINSNTVLHMHRFFVGLPNKPYRIVPGVVRRWGEDTFDSALLPANTPLRIAFKNNGEETKHAFGELSILYGDA